MSALLRTYWEVRRWEHEDPRRLAPIRSLLAWQNKPLPVKQMPTANVPVFQQWGRHWTRVEEV